MAELTVEEIDWVKKQKSIKEKEQELESSNKSFDDQIRAVKTQATSDINSLTTQKIAAETTLKEELESIK